MKIPIRKLRKADIVWLAEHNCRHDHSYLSHYQCFLTEKPDTSPLAEAIGIFDIETTGLQANWSHLLAWCLKAYGGEILDEDVITRKEARDKKDERLVRSAVRAIQKYDRIITFYGSRFDIPYLRSRAMAQGIAFPSYKDMYHTDLYYIVRNKLRIHSNRLASVCQFLGIPAKETPMTPSLWQRAGAGEQSALEDVLMHCREDVYSTDLLFDFLLDHMAIDRRSV